MTPATDIRNGVDADTQIIATKLITGQASQEERDRALATVLLSLWKQDELRRLIVLVHAEECGKCPLKGMLGDKEESKWQQVAFALLKYGGWLAAAVVYLVKYQVGG